MRLFHRSSLIKFSSSNLKAGLPWPVLFFNAERFSRICRIPTSSVAVVSQVFGGLNLSVDNRYTQLTSEGAVLNLQSFEISKYQKLESMAMVGLYLMVGNKNLVPIWTLCDGSANRASSAALALFCRELCPVMGNAVVYTEKPRTGGLPHVQPYLVRGHQLNNLTVRLQATALPTAFSIIMFLNIVQLLYIHQFRYSS